MLNKLLLQRPLFLGALLKLEIHQCLQLAIVFIILFLTPMVFADLIIPPPTLSETSASGQLTIPPGGSTRIIIELDMDAASSPSSIREGDRDTSLDLEEQAEQVASVQEMFLNNLNMGMLTPTDNPVKVKFTYVPSVVMKVDRFLLRQIQRNPLVKSVVEDKTASLSLLKSIPLIGADKTRQSGYTGSGQAVAILDTGVDKTHFALQNGEKSKVIAEACFSTTDQNLGSKSLCPNKAEEQIGEGSGVPCQKVPGCDHGTHVAGIATANDDRDGIYGVAPVANIVAIQVASCFNSNGKCDESSWLLVYDSDIIRALEHVLKLHENGKAIAAVNLSLGSGHYYDYCDDENPSLTNIINQLRQVGVATVVASGNDFSGDSMGLPACISSAISVGAICDEDNIVYPGTETVLCQSGKDSVATFSNSAYFLNLLAPGIWINSTVPGDAFGIRAGTSMAAPFVAGAWAVMKSIKPEATVAEILSVLQETGKSILDERNGLSTPLIQLDDAVQALIGVTEPPPATEPPPDDSQPPPVDPPSLAAILPDLSVVSDEQGFHFMWKQAAELDSGGGMNLWCATMDEDNHTFKDLTQVNSQLAAAIDEAFYPKDGIKGVKYCVLQEINAAGESTLHCDAAVVISDDTAVNIIDLEAAKTLCHSLTP
jgi:subtilisin family serine protease